MWDELNEPLGLGPAAFAAPPAGGFRLSGRAVASLAACALAIGLVALARRNAPPGADGVAGGEPFAVAKVEMAPAPPKPAPKEAAPPAAREAAGPPIASAGQAEAASRVKVIRGGGGPPTALIIDVARALGAKTGPPAGAAPAQPSP